MIRHDSAHIQCPTPADYVSVSDLDGHLDPDDLRRLLRSCYHTGHGGHACWSTDDLADQLGLLDLGVTW